jgi:hypothetical protein
MWCHSRLRASTNPIDQNSHILDSIFFFTFVLSFSTPNSVITLICCSSSAIEGVLAGFADARTYQGVPALTGSLPDRSSVNFCGDPWKSIWPAGWSKGRPCSFAAHARAGASVCDQILHQHMCMLVFIYSNGCVAFASSVPDNVFHPIIMKNVSVE